MRTILCAIACLLIPAFGAASACDGSDLVITNASSNPLTVKEVDTSGRILFMPSHHTRIENLSTGTVIQPRQSVTAKLYSVKHSAGGANVHLVLTTHDDQTIEFTSIYKLNLFNENCHAHVFGRSIKISDSTHYTIANHHRHGKPATLDVRITGT